MPSGIFQPGAHLGKYEVLAHIASGGMGEVYKAHDTVLGRAVALKVLPPDRSEGGRLERFRSEARHAAKLNHPNIVTLYECGYDEKHEVHFLALEFVEGVDLETHIARRGRLSPDDARRILIQAARALDHAYQHGIVHRDIKPANFLLTKQGGRVVVKLTDLGLALGGNDEDFKVTREGNTVGTVDYMSPEQARNSRAADIRSDIYSLGCTGFHLLAGRPPFAEGGLGERLMKHVEAQPPDVRDFNPAVSEAFWDVLRRMMAKKPVHRYATPADLLLDLKKMNPRAEDEEDDPTILESAVERKTVHEPASDVPVLTPEQVRAAAAFHTRAVQVLLEGKGDDYARNLLNQALENDPFNPTFHKTLRALNRKGASRWFGSLNILASRSKMHLAKSASNWRKVLQHGEEILVNRPDDAEAHRELAEAALALGQNDLALWYVHEGRDALPEDIALMRTTAEVHEARQEWKEAMAAWEQVTDANPHDVIAARKLNDLLAREHLAAGHYKR